MTHHNVLLFSHWTKRLGEIGCKNIIKRGQNVFINLLLLFYIKISDSVQENFVDVKVTTDGSGDKKLWSDYRDTLVNQMNKFE